MDEDMLLDETLLEATARVSREVAEQLTEIGIPTTINDIELRARFVRGAIVWTARVHSSSCSAHGPVTSLRGLTSVLRPMRAAG